MSWHSIGTRAGIGIGLVLVLLTAALLGVYTWSERASVIRSETDAARNLLLVAESVRTRISEKWRDKHFTTESVREVASHIEDPEARRQWILSSVPVFNAWMAIGDAASEGDYQLRTPRLGARNPKNEPDEVERQALAYLDAHPEAKEYYRVDEATNALRYFRTVRLTADCLLCHGDPKTAEANWAKTDGTDILGYPMENKQVGDPHGAFEIIKSLNKADSELMTRVMRTAGGLSVVLVLICALTFLVIKRQIVDPFTVLGERLQDMAQGDGDLTKRLQVSGKTEVAWLSSSFNKFMAKVQRTVTEIIQSGSRIAGQSQSLSTVTGSLMSGVQEQQRGTGQVRDALHSLLGSIENIAQNASITANAAREADQEAKAGLLMVQEVRHSIDQLAGDVERGAHVIRELNEYSTNIGSVIDVIRGIADQTNLLALNAAIEAARAGEQGRGFAVVADEVRVLASRTQQSTQEIQETIQRLQDTARRASLVMEESQNRAVQSVERASAAGEKLDRITSMVNTITSENANIANAAEAQSRMSQDINRSISQIGERVTATAREAERTDDISRSLAQLAEDLRAAISYFRT